MTRYALAALATILFTGTAQGQNCPIPGDVNQLATTLAQGITQARATNGAAAIGIDTRLMAAAQRQACDLARTGHMAHGGSDGSTAETRVRDSGYRACLTAENLAWGFPQPGQIITGWLNSPGHRSNMLHPRAASYGVGIAQGAQGPIWVLVLAREC